MICVFGYTDESYELFINTPHTFSVKKSQIYYFLYKTLNFQIENRLNNKFLNYFSQSHNPSDFNRSKLTNLDKKEKVLYMSYLSHAVRGTLQMANYNRVHLHVKLHCTCVNTQKTITIIN